MRSEIFITAGMSCSTSSTVTPRSRTPRTSSTARMVSSWFMPAKGSSSSSTLRVGGEPDGDAERAQMALRQVAGDARSRLRRRPRKSRISSAERPNSASSRRAGARAEIEAEEAGARAQMMGDDDVVAHRSCP